MSDHGDRINDVSTAGLLTWWRNAQRLGIPPRVRMEIVDQTTETLARLFELGGFDALREGHAIAPLRHDGKPAQPGDWFEDFRGEQGNYICQCNDCGIMFHGYKRRVICKVCAINKLAGIKKINVDTSNTSPEHRVGFEDAIRRMGDINEKLQVQLSGERHQRNELQRQYDLQGLALVKAMHDHAIEAQQLNRELDRLIELEKQWTHIAQLLWLWILERSAALRFCARIVASNRAR